MTRPCSRPALNLRIWAGSSPFRDARMLWFKYLVSYDTDSSQAGNDPSTHEEVVKALGIFRDDLRFDVSATDQMATAGALLSKTTRTTTRTIIVKAGLGAGTPCDAVQRCATRRHLNAALLTCS